MRYRFTLLCGLLALFAFLSTAIAQTSRGTLSGTVRPRGDGIVVIAEIIGLDKKEFTPLLSNTSFRVNTLTFSSNATGIG